MLGVTNLEVAVQLSDSAQAPSGRFKLTVFRRGILVEEIDEPNLIVNLSKGIHAQLLGGNFAGNNVSVIGFGTNGTAPAAANTSLTGAYTKALDGVSYGAGAVTFAFSLLATEANGLAIQEFGLITASGALYARKTRSRVLNKDSDFAFTGTWTITF